MAIDPRAAAAPAAEPDGRERALGAPLPVIAPLPVPGPGSAAPRLPATPDPTAGGWLESICPYLRAADASWRSAVPTREHRCWAVSPASALPAATQQDLCLTQAHRGCERFLHSQELRASSLARDQIEVGRLEHARFAPLVSPVPVAVDPRPSPSGQGSRRSGRRRLPALVIGGGVILVGAAVLAAFFGGGRVPGVAVASPTPTPLVTATAPRATLDPTAAATPEVTPRPTVAPTPRATTHPTSEPTAAPTPPPDATPGPRATATPAPSLPPGVRIARRYTVKEGDTIKSIANKFGVKPRELRAINDIGADVEPGQRLLIPVAGTVPLDTPGTQGRRAPGALSAGRSGTSS